MYFLTGLLEPGGVDHEGGMEGDGARLLYVRQSGWKQYVCGRVLGVLTAMSMSTATPAERKRRLRAQGVAASKALKKARHADHTAASAAAR